MFRKKYKASLPYILNEISKQALEFNSNREDDFDKSFRCIAFAFDGSRLLDFGINKNKTHPSYAEYVEKKRMTTHAEISMLINLAKKKNIDKVTDIVLVRGAINLLDSFPCELCYPHLKDNFNSVRMWYYKNNEWQMEIL